MVRMFPLCFFHLNSEMSTLGNPNCHYLHAPTDTFLQKKKTIHAGFFVYVFDAVALPVFINNTIKTIFRENLFVHKTWHESKQLKKMHTHSQVYNILWHSCATYKEHIFSAFLLAKESSHHNQFLLKPHALFIIYPLSYSGSFHLLDNTRLSWKRFIVLSKTAKLKRC